MKTPLTILITILLSPAFTLAEHDPATQAGRADVQRIQSGRPVDYEALLPGRLNASSGPRPDMQIDASQRVSSILVPRGHLTAQRLELTVCGQKRESLQRIFPASRFTGFINPSWNFCQSSDFLWSVEAGCEWVGNSNYTDSLFSSRLGDSFITSCLRQRNNAQRGLIIEEDGRKHNYSCLSGLVRGRLADPCTKGAPVPTVISAAVPEVLHEHLSFPPRTRTLFEQREIQDNVRWSFPNQRSSSRSAPPAPRPGR